MNTSDPFTFKEVGTTFAPEVLLAELIEIGLTRVPSDDLGTGSRVTNKE